MTNIHLSIINDDYVTDIPKKTILVWSLLFTWQNDGNKKKLRNELQQQASVPDGAFDRYISDFVDQGIIDSPESCRLRVDNGSFNEVRKLVEADLGPLDELPFDSFRFQRNNQDAMRKVWAEGGCQLLIDTWSNIPDISYEIQDWSNASLYEARTVTFKTKPDKPAIVFYFTVQIQPADRSNFSSLYYHKAEILKQHKGEVITLAGALSFGTGTFDSNSPIRVLMYGPITLTTIIKFFDNHPDHTAKLYDAFVEFLHPTTGQKEGIVKGDGLIRHFRQVVSSGS